MVNQFFEVPGGSKTWQAPSKYPDDLHSNKLPFTEDFFLSDLIPKGYPSNNIRVLTINYYDY